MSTRKGSCTAGTEELNEPGRDESGGAPVTAFGASVSQLQMRRSQEAGA